MSIKVDVRPGPMSPEYAVHRFRFFRRRLARLYGHALNDRDLDALVLANLWTLPAPMRAAIYRELYRRHRRREQKRRTVAASC